MVANFGPAHLLVLAVVMVLMFAGNKLPDASRSLGKSLRLFKSELHELHTADKADEPAARPPRSRWGGSTPLRIRLPTKPTPTLDGQARPGFRTSVQARG